MEKPLVGLLPFYLELYDKTSPEERPAMEAYLSRALSLLRSHGMEVICAPICRVSREFEEAADQFNDAGVCAVLTLHLAYSPSLESIKALKRIKAPIIVLDTTPTCNFTVRRDEGEIMGNHGIHGVQDMCSLLLRNGVHFWLEAGHLECSDILERVEGLVRAAHAASRMRSARVGSLGGHFAGMGDFMVSAEDIQRELGVTVVPFDFTETQKLRESVTQEEIDAEYALDKSLFDIEAKYDEDYRETLRSCLMLRHWLEREGLNCFTYNFGTITKASGIPRVPFFEASKAMARGQGFAGEGDTLTAALMYALLGIYPDTTFAEMFCPGWSDDTVFLSHMGEYNLRISARRPVVRKKAYSFSDSGDMAVAYGTFRAGKAVYVNLTPAGGGRYRLILSPIEMLEPDSPEMKCSLEGYFHPCLPLTRFLKEFSLAGGTHHGAIVYGGDMEVLKAFGEMSSFEVKLINGGGKE
ncbi:MAG: hypothetical protein AB9835_14070 [Eubacteriales bacterium]